MLGAREAQKVAWGIIRWIVEQSGEKRLCAREGRVGIASIAHLTRDPAFVTPAGTAAVSLVAPTGCLKATCAQTKSLEVLCTWHESCTYCVHLTARLVLGLPAALKIQYRRCCRCHLWSTTQDCLHVFSGRKCPLWSRMGTALE